MTARLGAVVLILAGRLAGQTTLDDAAIEKAIALGAKYTDPEKLWRKAFEKTNADDASRSLSTVMHLSVVTDQAMIATAACNARHERRPFGLEEAKSLPDLGSLKAVLRAGGLSRDAARNLHVIIRLPNGEILQPSNRRNIEAGSESGTVYWLPYFWIPYNASYALIEYTFTPPLNLDGAKFVLILANDKERVFGIDTAKLR